MFSCSMPGLGRRAPEPVVGESKELASNEIGVNGCDAGRRVSCNRLLCRSNEVQPMFQPGRISHGRIWWRIPAINKNGSALKSARTDGLGELVYRQGIQDVVWREPGAAGHG